MLGVITKWVVPPISKVLAEREAMLAKTAADNRKSAEQVAAAQADYDEAMAGARTEASSIRDEARAAGRQVIDEKRAEASGEVAETVRAADEQLSATGFGGAGRTGFVGGRTVGHVGQPHPRRRREFGTEQVDVDLHRAADRLRGHRVHHRGKYVVPPVRTLMQKQQDAVRAALAESAEAAKKLDDADADARQGA